MTTGGVKKVLCSPAGAAYLAQTPHLLMVNNVPEVYWYGWDDYVLGVNVTDPVTGARCSSLGIAYNTAMKLDERGLKTAVAPCRRREHLPDQAEG